MKPNNDAFCGLFKLFAEMLIASRAGRESIMNNRLANVGAIIINRRRARNLDLEAIVLRLGFEIVNQGIVIA